MKRLLAALLLVPLADALLLVFVAGLVGWRLTVAAVVLTALLGMLFVRAEGRHALQEIQAALAEGRAPTDELLDGGLLVAAGAFLLTPGLVTDALGFLLVVPLTRSPIRALLKKYVVVPKLDAKTGGFASGNVYTFGFPGDDDGGADFGGSWPSGTGAGGGSNADAGSGSDADDSYDLGGDAYDIEFDDEDDRE